MDKKFAYNIKALKDEHLNTMSIWNGLVTINNANAYPKTNWLCVKDPSSIPLWDMQMIHLLSLTQNATTIKVLGKSSLWNEKHFNEEESFFLVWYLVSGNESFSADWHNLKEFNDFWFSWKPKLLWTFVQCPQFTSTF